MTVIKAPSFTVDGEAMKDEAFALSKLLSDTSINVLVEASKLDDKRRETIFDVVARLSADYGDKLASFPIVGTGKVKDGAIANPSNHPEWFKVKARNAKNEPTTKEVSFFQVLVEGKPQVKKMLDDAAFLERMNNAEDARTNIPKELIDTYGRDAILRNGEIKYLRNKVTGFVSRIRNAVAFMQQMESVNAIPNVACIPFMDDSGNVRRTLEPLHFFKVSALQADGTPVPHLLDARTMGVGNFMKMNVAKAKEVDGGSYDSLIATLARVKDKEDGPDSLLAPQHIETAETFLARVNDIHSFMDKAWMDKTGGLYGKLLKALAAPGSDDTLASIDEMADMFKSILEMPAIAKRLIDIREGNATKAA